MESDEKVCPRCAETVKAAALVCKHCKHEFGVPNTTKPSPIAQPATPSVVLPKKKNFLIEGLILVAAISVIAFMGSKLQRVSGRVSATSEATEKVLPPLSPPGKRAVAIQVLSMSVAIAATKDGFLITGSTNLPVGTELTANLRSEFGERQDRLIVGQNGLFYGEFAVSFDAHTSWPKGQYNVDILGGTADIQNFRVQEAAGHDWGNFTGPLFDYAMRPQVKFSFAYNGSTNFFALKTFPFNASLPAPDIAWARKGLKSRSQGRIAAQKNSMSTTVSDNAPVGQQNAPSNLQTISRAHYGCVHEEYFKKLTQYRIDNDREAWTSALEAGTAVGECSQFAPGDKVFIEDTAVFSGLIKVRRRGEAAEYWTAIEATK